MARPTCKDCQYFQQHNPDSDFNEGNCRRRAPNTDHHFPQMMAEYWCGEHKPIKAETTSVLTNNGVEHLTDKEIIEMAEGLQEPDQSFAEYEETQT